MRIIGTVTEIPPNVGGGRGSLSPDIIEIIEAVKGGDILQVEFDISKTAQNRCNRLKRLGYKAAVRNKTMLYVSRNGTS